MFADDKKNAPKGGVQPKNIVATETPTVSGDQVVDMVGAAAGAVGGKAGKVVSQAADIAKKAGSIASSVGINPKNIVSGGSAAGIASSAGVKPMNIVSSGNAAGMASSAGVKPMNFASGGSATAMASSAISALLGGAEPSGLQFTLFTANLPPQTFVVVDFSLTEMLSSPFVLNVGLASADPAIDFAAVLDEDATLVIKREGVVQRSITGMVASFEQGDTGLHQTRYSMVIRPALWRTTLRRNSRIFQQQSIENIITTLLKENGITDFAFGLRNPHPAREFCVQYQESDFDFIQRLAAEEGMFYYFEYPEGKNIVVYTDDVGTLPQGAVLPYNPGVASQALELCVTTFTRSAQVRTAVVELKDYTFKNPQWSAAFNEQASELQNQRPDYEHFDFPGRFKDEQHGKAFTHYRLEALRNDANLGQGQSNDFTLQPGLLFTLTSHPRGDLNHQWQLLSIQHSGSQPQALEQESGGQGTTLSNQFVFLPHTQTWRPTPMPKPSMDGPQIAMVVGPAGEEIYCDEFGRIRLQFLWDRYGKSNDNSSCWIRVTQPWAGQGWGMLAIPRIGQEVVVDFLHGDPDQPIVTGRTYHANNIPPGSLPASKTQMAFRSKTHKGEGFNELRFEDAKGGEGLFMHAQKDMSTTVKNDQSLTVESGNRTLNILAGNETKTVKQGGLTETICTMRSTSANQVQVKAKAGKSGPGTQLYESSDDITLKVGAGEIKMTTSSIKITFGGSCIQLDAGGVYVDGAVVHLNKGSSGGAAAAVSETEEAAASATTAATAAGAGPASPSKLPTQKATVQAPASPPKLPTQKAAVQTPTKQRPKHVQKFIDQALPAAQKAQQDWGIPVSVTLAQSAQETGWGKSVKNNAYFGIKGVSPTGKSGVFNTTEVIDGKVISISDKFRAYNDFAESADDYGRFLNKNPRYAEALKHKDDPFMFSKEVAKAGYATDPKYADKIASIIKSQGLTDYDK